MQKRIQLLILVLILSYYPTFALAQSGSSNSYQLKSPDIIISGSNSSSSNYGITSILGNNLDGESDGNSYKICSGLIEESFGCTGATSSTSPAPAGSGSSGSQNYTSPIIKSAEINTPKTTIPEKNEDPKIPIENSKQDDVEKIEVDDTELKETEKSEQENYDNKNTLEKINTKKPQEIPNKSIITKKDITQNNDKNIHSESESSLLPIKELQEKKSNLYDKRWGLAIVPFLTLIILFFVNKIKKQYKRKKTFKSSK